MHSKYTSGDAESTCILTSGAVSGHRVMRFHENTRTPVIQRSTMFRPVMVSCTQSSINTRGQICAPAGHSLFCTYSLSYVGHVHVPLSISCICMYRTLSGSRKTSLTVRAQSTPGRELCPLITHLMSHWEGLLMSVCLLPHPPPPLHTYSTFPSL